MQNLKAGLLTKGVKVSVIIPCYNTGEYLEEAIQSVFQSSFQDFEIIVVNDGSTEEATLSVLSSIDYPFTRLIHQENGGLASARNSGVKLSSGDLLFFLDSDNRARKGYFEKALEVFESHPNVGVVYAKPVFFGESTDPRFESRNFNFEALLAGNYIDACAFVRREAFEAIGGFDESRELKISEDWEFWIRLAQTSWRFHFLDEELFYYRIRKDSMIGEQDQKKIETTLNYIGKKHGFVFHRHYRKYFKVVKKIEKQPFTFFLKIIYHKYILRKSIWD